MLIKRTLLAATVALLLYALIAPLQTSNQTSGKHYPKNPQQVTQTVKGMTPTEAKNYIATHTDYTSRTAPNTPSQDYSPIRINLVVVNNEVLGAYFG